MYTEAQSETVVNHVMPLLHSDFMSRDLLGEITQLWAYNFGVQAVGGTMICYVAWLVLEGTTNVIELCFQIKGYKRNSVNCGFAATKNMANSTDIWCPADYSNLINTSTATGTIHPVSFIDDPDGTIFRNWEALFALLMKPVEGIQKFQCFRFEASAELGTVKIRRFPDDSWTIFNLLKKLLYAKLNSFEISVHYRSMMWAEMPKRHTFPNPFRNSRFINLQPLYWTTKLVNQRIYGQKLNNNIRRRSESQYIPEMILITISILNPNLQRLSQDPARKVHHLALKIIRKPQKYKMVNSNPLPIGFCTFYFRYCIPK